MVQKVVCNSGGYEQIPYAAEHRVELDRHMIRRVGFERPRLLTRKTDERAMLATV
jgi:hypothetical protein